MLSAQVGALQMGPAGFLFVCGLRRLGGGDRLGEKLTGGVLQVLGGTACARGGEALGREQVGPLEKIAGGGGFPTVWHRNCFCWRCIKNQKLGNKGAKSKKL